MRRTGILAGTLLLALSAAVLAAEGDAARFSALLAKDPLAGSVRLSRLGDDALPVIEELLASEDAPVRRGAALAAGRMGE